MSTPILGFFLLNCLASSIKTPTPLPPSFAPSIGLLWFSVSWSAMCLLSQWANRATLLFFSREKLAIIFFSI